MFQSSGHIEVTLKGKEDEAFIAIIVNVTDFQRQAVSTCEFISTAQRCAGISPHLAPLPTAFHAELLAFPLSHVGLRLDFAGEHTCFCRTQDLWPEPCALPQAEYVHRLLPQVSFSTSELGHSPKRGKRVRKKMIFGIRKFIAYFCHCCDQYVTRLNPREKDLFW